MFNSRNILFFFLLVISNTTYGQATRMQTKILSLGNTKVEIIQRYNSVQAVCSAKILIYVSGQKKDSIIFPSMEAVGGDVGLFLCKDRINNHIIISKFGDYDGQTIVINDRGQKFVFGGGRNYADKEQGIIFCIYDSDLPGFSVFDLTKDQLIIDTADIDGYPNKFYKKGGHYYCELVDLQTNSHTIWEIDFNSKSIKYLYNLTKDFDAKPLSKLEFSKDLNCEIMYTNY